MKHSLRGSSYFEVILYLGLFSMMATALFQYAWDTIDLSVKNRTERRVLSDARILSERLNAIIRNATGVDTSDSNFDFENGKLVLDEDSGERVQISLVEGRLILNRGGVQTILHSNQSRVKTFGLSYSGQAINHSESVSYILSLDSSDSEVIRDAAYLAPTTLRSGGYIRKSGL